MMVSLRPGMEKDRDEVLRQLIDIQYDRNDMDFKRGTFRVRGDAVEIVPADRGDTAIRVEFFGDEIDRISEIDMLTGEIEKYAESHCDISGFSLCCSERNVWRKQFVMIEIELEEQVKYFKSAGQASGSTENCRTDKF